MRRIGKIGAMLLFCVMLCACTKQQTTEQTAVADAAGDGADEDGNAASDEDNGGQSQDVEKEQPAEPERKAEDFVGQQFTFTGELGDEEELGYTVEVSYTVPKLLSDGSAADAINNDIYTFCRDVIEPGQEESDFPTWYEVDYEAFLNGNILSIVVSKHCTMDEATACAMFNYNVEEKSVVDNLTLLRFCGYTEESFVTQMRRAVAYEADESIRDVFEAQYWNSDDTDDTERQTMYADCIRYRQASIATDRVHAQMPMYLDEAGELKVYAEIDVPAGAGFYQTVLAPRTENKAKDFEISFEDSLFIIYKSGIMKIRIEAGDWTGASFGGYASELEFGREYTVEGIYKDYVDGEMQFVCDGEYAVPVFVSDDGMVSALNLYECARAGYFCLTEPVMGLSEIEAVTETNGSSIADEVGNTLFGQCAGFAAKAVGVYGQQAFGVTHTGSGEDGSGSYGYYISFDEQDEGRLLYQTDRAEENDFLCYSGECVLVGMNEDGLVFVSRVYAEDIGSFDTDDHYSIFSLKRNSVWDDVTGDPEEWVDFRSLGGFITLGGTGDLMRLTISYG